MESFFRRTTSLLSRQAFSGRVTETLFQPRDACLTPVYIGVIFHDFFTRGVNLIPY